MRVKFVYQGGGEFAPATGQPGTCKHPREMLRFDGRYALPMVMFCRACGTVKIHPFHGLTDEQIAERKKNAEKLWKASQ